MSKEVNITSKNLLIAVLSIAMPAIFLPGLLMANEQERPSTKDSSNKYFRIQVEFFCGRRSVSGAKGRNNIMCGFGPD